jgi:amino-acid N-acetyltransferase
VTITIRGAAWPDAEAIVALSAPFVRRDLLLPRTTAQIRGRIEEFVVACGPDSGLLGCVGLRRYGDVALLYNLCVRTAAQGRGIGPSMLEFAIASCRVEGCVTVLAASKYAGAWFVRQGFHQIPTDQPAHRRFLVGGRGSMLYQLPVATRPARERFVHSGQRSSLP